MVHRITSRGLEEPRKVGLKKLHVYLTGYGMDRVIVTELDRNQVTLMFPDSDGRSVTQDRRIAEDLIATGLEQFEQRRGRPYPIRKVEKTPYGYEYVWERPKGGLILQMPRLNKQGDWREYTRQLPGGPMYEGLLRVPAVIQKKITLTTKEYDRFVENFMADREDIAGLGGATEYAPGEYATNVAEIKARNRRPIYVDPSGYSYARYVLFPTDATSSWTPEKTTRPKVGMPTQTAKSLNVELAERGLVAVMGSERGRRHIVDSTTGKQHLANASSAEAWAYIKAMDESPARAPAPVSESVTTSRQYVREAPKKSARLSINATDTEWTARLSARNKTGRGIIARAEQAFQEIEAYGRGSLEGGLTYWKAEPLSPIELNKLLLAFENAAGINDATSSKKKAAKKKASKKVTKKAAKKTTSKKRARPKAADEIRLYKRTGKLIATFGVTYKLTQAMESVRDCARRSKPCKLKTVIQAYDQMVKRAKSPGKSPMQGLAYYVAAEMAKDLRRSDELEATGKGDLPRIKEA